MVRDTATVGGGDLDLRQRLTDCLLFNHIYPFNNRVMN